MRLLLLLLASNLYSATVVYVACGSGSSALDFGYVGGATYATGYPTAPYDHERYSNPPATPFSYNFNVPAAVYNVIFGFIETSRTAAGQRVFDIQINGNTVLSKVDVFALAGGAMKPYTVSVQAPSTGIMAIRFVPAAGSAAAIVSTITVSTPDTPPPVGLPPGMTWDGTTLKIAGRILAVGYDVNPGTPLMGIGWPMPGSQVPTPPSGAVTVFSDAENSNKLTRKDWNNKLYLVEGTVAPPPAAGLVEQCVDTLYPVTTFFQQASPTGTADIATIPANIELRSAWIFEDSLVTAGPGVTKLSAYIGTKGTPFIFAGPFQLMGLNIPPFREYPATGGLAVTSNTDQLAQLQLAVIEGPGNLSALTGGVIKTRICTLDTSAAPAQLPTQNVTHSPAPVKPAAAPRKKVKK